MKKIYFGPKGTVKWHEPFWKPWGCLGCLGRLLLYLVLLFTLMFLLNMFKMCTCSSGALQLPDDILNPTGENPLPHVPVDTTLQFPNNIQNPGNNLPSPGDNFIPPYDDNDVITDDDTHQQIVGNKLNVILDSRADDSTFRQWADEFKRLYPGEQYSIVFYDPLTKLLQIQIPEQEREAIMQNLPNQITDISFKVFPEGLMGEAAQPNDPIFQHQEIAWYFNPIQAYEAWQITKGSPDVVVAIVDSYFDLNHDDLNSDRIVHPFSVPRHTGNVAPAQGADEVAFMHGSMVASQALGNMDNNRGTAGIAPGCKFMPVSLGHRFTMMTILEGLLYAIYQGADVINISAGCSFDPSINSMSTEQQIAFSQQECLIEADVWNYVANLANERNVTIVWAAGNDNVFAAMDPSKRGDATIKVSAVDKNLRKADFSNYGNFPDRNIEESTISAPGVDIMGAMPYNTYNIGPGTSFAAPIVTGAVALMKSLDPTLTTTEIASILQETGKPIQGDNSIGKLIQIKDALLKVQSSFANMNDIMNNHQQFLGLWQSTRLLKKYTNGQETGDHIRIFFNITAENQGQIIYYEESSTKKDYVAPLRLLWQQNKITMKQEQNAVNETATDTYVPCNYVCTPGNQQRLQCTYTTENSGSTEPFFLRRAERRNNE